MKKVTAFVCALLLFLVTIVSFHMCAKVWQVNNTYEFAAWSNTSKFASGNAISNNITDNTLVMFGSSEFQHGKDTVYYPGNIFRGSDMEPMLIGAGYYQSLQHAITLAAIGNDIKNKKAVIFLSPTWFRKDGIKSLAFASNFSEMNYVEMLKNSNISDETKLYIQKRVHNLLEVDKTTLSNLECAQRVLDVSLIQNDKSTLLDNIKYSVYQGFLNEKSLISVATQFKIRETKQLKCSQKSDGNIDWEKYYDLAESESQSSEQNDFYMSPIGYEKVKSKLSTNKDCLKDVTNMYSKSPEYDDLRCFLDVCRDLEIEPLLIALPVNGYWYDYMGAGSLTRAKYYQNIRQIAREYDAELADLSVCEFEKYFFEDGLHLAGKGWVSVDEILYKFKTEDKGQ